MARQSHDTLNRMKTTPIPVQRSRRSLDIRCLTSLPVGKCVPIAAFGLLREDAVSMSRLRINFEQLETVEILMNAVNVRVLAYLVPNLAFDRFNGIDQLNRSYQKQPETDGGTVQPYFESTAFASASNKILTSMGKHAREGQAVNTAYIEAYNEIYNFRVANRSPDLAKRLKTEQTLAKAFWMHQNFAHIVPDFDQALVDGEVSLNVTDASVKFTPSSLNVKGLISMAAGTAAGNVLAPSYPGASATTGSNLRTLGYQALPTDDKRPTVDFSLVSAELAENGISVSLSNIELARRTQAFALLRKQYTGHTDDYIIDLLMSGISVPEQAWRQPILLADRTTIFGMAKRYASDSTDLTASVTNGATFIDLAITTPRVPTGGVVMIMAEITPEQLWERQMDPYLFALDQDLLPEFMRDTLDPEKVEIVQNQYVDVDHTTPTATFGYAPLNHQWNAIGPMIGGKFYRPKVNAPFDEDRQRLWAVETANPTLAEDFYLCTNMHSKPFVQTTVDNHEAVMRGQINITGNTVFGRLLIEASDDYETIAGEAPIDRIDKPASLESDDNSGTSGAGQAGSDKAEPSK